MRGGGQAGPGTEATPARWLQGHLPSTRSPFPLPDTQPLSSHHSSSVKWVGWTGQSLFDSSNPQSANLRTPPVDISIAWDSWIPVTAVVWMENFKNNEINI